jgi:hypothetical protein
LHTLGIQLEIFSFFGQSQIKIRDDRIVS